MRTIDGLNIVVILFVYHYPSNPIAVFHHFRGFNVLNSVYLHRSKFLWIIVVALIDKVVHLCVKKKKKKNTESIGAYFYFGGKLHKHQV